MHLGRIILLAGAALAVATVCPAQTSPTTSGGPTGLQPDKVPVIQASKGPQEALSAYKEAKREALHKMVKLAGVPPASPVRVASDCEAYTIVVKDALSGLEKRMTITTTARSGGFVMPPKQIREIREYIEQERKQWDDLTKMTQAAANYQLELRVNKAMLKKAADDAPQQIKALVEELRAVEDRIKDYLKGAQGDPGKQRQARQFVSTVTGNVQHAWTSLIKAGEEVLGKKELKPEAYKKRMDSIISTLPHQAGHISKADPQFAEAKSDMAKQMKKEQKLYAEIYEKVVKARAPLVSGSAAQEVPTFRDAKPDQLKARAQQQMQ